MTKFRPNLLF